MKYRPDVLVVGRCCVDYIAVVDTFPKEDTKAPLAFRSSKEGDREEPLHPVLQDSEERLCMSAGWEMTQRVDSACSD